MKRKIFIACISILLLVSFGASALVYDNINGLQAVAQYMGNKKVTDEQLENVLQEWIKNFDKYMHDYKCIYMSTVKKITKAEELIIKRALREYSLSPGDIYFIVVIDENTYIMTECYLRIDSVSENGWDGYITDFAKFKIVQ
ncbi:MAG: hypothetical protein J6S91_05045 [Treponema sp.]|nr:hypothetical protein [Treponema sp.]